MKTLTLVMALAASLCLTGCNSRKMSESKIVALSESDVAAFMGGTNTFNTVKFASKVEAYTLSAAHLPSGVVADYSITGGPISVVQDLVGNLSGILTDTKSYETDSGKLCMTLFGVRLKFTSETNSVDVLLCFDCDILAFAPEGKVIHEDNFDPARPKLVKIVKAIFPDDKIIQGLKE